MRPQLKPALRRVWRDPSTLQVGVDPERAVVISGLHPAEARLVDSLDGTLDLDGVLGRAAALGLEESAARRLIDVLQHSGVLDDAAADVRPLASLPETERARLAPDLAALSITRGGARGGAAALHRRRSATVAVHGAGRVGASVAALLAAGGVGRVDVHDPEPTGPADVSPSGLGPDAVGVPRAEAVRERVARLVPSSRVTSSQQRAADAAVLCPSGPLRPAIAERLMTESVPHLLVRIREDTGVIGPLVVPGRTSCLRCHDLHRVERDPTWAVLRAQLGPCSTVEPCDTSLATATAALAVLQLFALIDDAGDPPAVDGTLELNERTARVRRRSWTAHPACGCQWARAG